jgi:hypothetical protein
MVPHVEVGSNISILDRRVVGGDKKGTQCMGYNWNTLFLGYKYGHLALQIRGILESDSKI